MAAALAALALSWAFVPGAGEKVAFLGLASLPTCPSLESTGLPCGQCGMTRSWVWAARGDWLRAGASNPAGFALWLWLLIGGGIGLLRLLRRDPGLARWPRGLVVAVAVAWIGLYLVAHQARLAGWNPLP